MNKTLKRLMSLGLAAALASVPLIACGDDEGDGALSGVAVTEQQWKDGIDNTVNATNFTETQSAESGDLYMRNTAYYDLDNGIVHINYEGNTGKYVCKDAYFIRDTERSELWWIAYDNIENAGEFVCDQTMYVQNGRRVFDLLERGWYGGIYGLIKYQTWDGEKYANREFPYNMYGFFVFDSTDGSYYYEGIGLYFKDNHCVGACVSESDVLITVSCSDFGTTSITVPSVVTAAVQKYKNTNPDLPYDFT